MQIWWQAHILLGDPTENGPTEGLEQQLHRYLKKVSLFYLCVSPSPFLFLYFTNLFIQVLRVSSVPSILCTKGRLRVYSRARVIQSVPLARLKGRIGKISDSCAIRHWALLPFLNQHNPVKQNPLRRWRTSVLSWFAPRSSSSFCRYARPPTTISSCARGLVLGVGVP